MSTCLCEQVISNATALQTLSLATARNIPAMGVIPAPDIFRSQRKHKGSAFTRALSHQKPFRRRSRPQRTVFSHKVTEKSNVKSVIPARTSCVALSVLRHRFFPRLQLIRVAVSASERQSCRKQRNQRSGPQSRRC
jgi:hypothetical protein